MDIKEANHLINELVKIHKFNNACWHIELTGRGGAYLKLDVSSFKSRTRETSNQADKVCFFGIKTTQEIASFFMSDASKKSGLFSVRKNFIKVYRSIQGKNVLKLVINHNVSKVYFKDFIEADPVKLEKL